MEAALSREDDTVLYHESRESKGGVMRRSLQYCVEQHLEELLITMVRVAQRFVISIMMCFMDVAKSLSTLGHEF